jgi:hypothetical protein
VLDNCSFSTLRNKKIKIKIEINFLIFKIFLKISKKLAKSVEFYTRKTKNFGFGLKMTKFVPKKYTAKETPQKH